MRRKLTKYGSIQVLGRAGLMVGTVIDVGVQRDSPDLRELFHDKPHVLFEPVREYHDEVRENYEKIDYTLEAIALSDRRGTFHLRDVRIDNEGTVSHVTPADEETENTRIVHRDTLDSYLETHDLKKPYLIKIDVDGHETEILKGARRALFDTSCLIFETTLYHLPERLRLAESAGLVLWDVVDITYYHGCLYQCDLVFVSDRAEGIIRTLNPRTRMALEPFDPEAWYSLHALPERD